MFLNTTFEPDLMSTDFYKTEIIGTPIGVPKTFQLCSTCLIDLNTGIDSFECWSSFVWQCVGCNSIIHGLYRDRMGTCPSETEKVTCPACSEAHFLLSSADFPDLTILVNRKNLTDDPDRLDQIAQDMPRLP